VVLAVVLAVVRTSDVVRPPPPWVTVTVTVTGRCVTAEGLVRTGPGDEPGRWVGWVGGGVGRTGGLYGSSGSSPSPGGGGGGGGPEPAVAVARMMVVGMRPRLVCASTGWRTASVAGDGCCCRWSDRKSTKRRNELESTLPTLRSCDTAPFSLWMVMELVLLAGVVGPLLLVAYANLLTPLGLSATVPQVLHPVHRKLTCQWLVFLCADRIVYEAPE